MVATIPTFTPSQDLLREIDAAVKETSLSPEALIRASVRTFLDQDRSWRELQREVGERARAMGIETEDDVEEFLDSLDDPSS